MIELNITSDKYIPKEELIKVFDELEAAEGLTSKMKAESHLQDLIDKDFDLVVEIEEAAIAMAAIAQQCTSELADELVPELDDDYIEEEYDDRALAKPLLASDFNSYDFKRRMCDFFEAGYHVDSFDLVKLFAEKLKVDYLL